MVNNQVNAEGRYQMKVTDQGRSKKVAAAFVLWLQKWIFRPDICCQPFLPIFEQFVSQKFGRGYLFPCCFSCQRYVSL